MSIEAINEQLLRAIGVGVALVDLGTMELTYRNDTFLEWFGAEGDTPSAIDLFPGLDADALRADLAAGRTHTAERAFKLGRRRMTVAMEFNAAGDAGEAIAVLVCQNITRIKELESMIDSYSMMVERNTLEIRREKEQVEKLLLNLMPRSVYEEYKTFGVVSPRLFEPVSVLTLDFVDFQRLVTAHDASVIVSELNDIFTAFDRIGEQFGCERIRTSGDSYVTVAGVPDPSDQHAESVAASAVRFLRYLERRNKSHPISWEARIGVATGSVIGSVVGVQKYIYDVFGPALTAARANRAAARPMSIAASKPIAALLEGRYDGKPLSGTPDILELTEHRADAAAGNA